MSEFWLVLAFFGFWVVSVRVILTMLHGVPNAAGAARLLPGLLVIIHSAANVVFGENDEGHEDERREEEGCEENSLFLNGVRDDAEFLATLLHDYRVTNGGLLLPDNLGWWVLLRSTTWFSRFVMYKFDDTRWIKNFRMSKPVILRVANLLAPYVEKKDTRYRRLVPVIVRVCCTLYKLAQGANLVQCSESFAVGVTTVSEMLRDVMRAINLVFRQQIQWPVGQRMVDCMLEFQRQCDLPGIVGAIDGIHFEIRKPSQNPEDYFYFKSAGYTIQCQAVVDVKRRFMDVYIGMPGSTHDVRVLKRSALYHRATHQNLFDARYSQRCFSPYLIGDKGYPLFPWLMTPHRESPNLARSVAGSLYNQKLRKARSVVEHSFGILKQCFRELGRKSDLQITFIPDVIVSCCLIHNILLGQTQQEVERLLDLLDQEGMVAEVVDNLAIDLQHGGGANLNLGEAEEKRSQLGVYLTTLRHIP